MVASRTRRSSSSRPAIPTDANNSNPNAKPAWTSLRLQNLMTALPCTSSWCEDGVLSDVYMPEADAVSDGVIVSRFVRRIQVVVDLRHVVPQENVGCL